MKKILLILFLSVLFCCSKRKAPIIDTILVEEYSFLQFEGKVSKVRQSNDTLYEYYGFVDKTCNFKSGDHYKIIDSYKSRDFTILKLEYLDTIPLEEQLCPGKRFSVIAFKNITSNQLGYLSGNACLTRDEVDDTIKINSLFTNTSFYLTYFSDSYLKELSTHKRISTKGEVKEILNAIGHNDFDSGKISYSSEELTKACIEKGYNPIGAGLVIDSLLH